ncbi:MAG: nitrate reductase molybdenum cofactor assembly chaperone [Sterolibacterium sp.]
MNPNLTYRALAALLSYPHEELLGSLAELRDVFYTDQRLKSADRAALGRLLDRLHDADLMDSESEYIDTFDRGRAASLNLFEHVHGESRDRGQAMVDLLALYERHDLALTVRDLPDFLPVFLEFLSLLDESEAQQQLQEVQHLLETIGATLTRRASPYAAVFQALLRLAGERHPERQLSNREGAPVEEDTTFEAIDQAWADQPVTFLGACSPQSAPQQSQTIEFHRRTA